MRTMPNYLPDEDNLLDGASLKSWLVYHVLTFSCEMVFYCRYSSKHLLIHFVTGMLASSGYG